MTNYEKAYEKAKKAGTAKQRTAKYVKWEEPGDKVVGVYVNSTAVPSRLGGEGYNQYLFETDEGLVKVALGRNADNEIGVILSPGQLYAIEFLGQEAITGGKRVNKFDVYELPMDDLSGQDDEKGGKDGKQVDTQ